jgi:hypothetical protein
MTWLSALLSAALLAAMPALAADREAPSEAQVDAALTQLKADPNLASERSVRTLRWAKPKDPPRPPGNRFGWFGDLLGWIAQSGRVVVWLAVAALAAVLVLAIVRLIRSMGPRSTLSKFDAPTHVRDLDIRPESLPDDIGAAALELWNDGQHRIALSLLYRGLLSRLVHVHRLPIRESTTEGDCIDLATRHLSVQRSDYVMQLIRIWQLAVYGGHEPVSEEVQALCTHFDAALTAATQDARA